MRVFGGLIAGWVVAFCTLWFTGWGPIVGAMWAGVICMAGMVAGMLLGFVWEVMSE